MIKHTLFKSDRYGFNNPDDQWDKDNIEFFIVGDSFAMGECVNRPHDFGSVLRTISNKASLNLGYSSNGPNIQYAVMREYLDKRVKNILWMYYEGNDLQDMLDTLDNSKIINNYLNDLKFSQNLKSKQNKLDELNDINIKKQLDYHQERERRRECGLQEKEKGQKRCWPQETFIALTPTINPFDDSNTQPYQHVFFSPSPLCTFQQYTAEQHCISPPSLLVLGF